VSRTGSAPEAAPDLIFTDSQTIVWSASSAASSYSLYRGSQGDGSWAFNHACLVPFLDLPAAEDTDIPPPGVAFYYLVSGRNACGEGTLGKSSALDERPNSSHCP